MAAAVEGQDHPSARQKTCQGTDWRNQRVDALEVDDVPAAARHDRQESRREIPVPVARPRPHPPDLHAVLSLPAWKDTIRVGRGDRHEVSASGETPGDFLGVRLNAAGEWREAR